VLVASIIRTIIIIHGKEKRMGEQSVLAYLKDCPYIRLVLLGEETCTGVGCLSACTLLVRKLESARV
jgi:hypothetical protein